MRKLTKPMTLLMVLLITSAFVVAQTNALSTAASQPYVEKEISGKIYDPADFTSGDYLLNLTETPPPLECPPGAIVEAEPCGAMLNDGCNMPSGTEVFEQVNYGDIFCGKTCTYVGPTGGASRDTDWFELVLTAPRPFILYAEADAPMIFYQLGLNGCGSVDVLKDITVSPGNPGEMDLGILEPGTYWFWAGLQVFSGYPEDVTYVIYFGEKPLPVIPVSNWALYLGILLMITFVVIRFRRMM